ncbi:uncharacterized protein LOC110449383 [Mizuhopecten yessoensis]|uniref:Cell polarity protein alp11 n=1 Tax=Mizuhopecten yessoensis TaxID=6573 RepID=A0A210QRC7_MIZYE|nr:uncharacterized protein LOC110449383 [Mizuhopecten yessoensis]OWF51292.1 Cell polarity protein alp11 [Mizuhopecten yessoensis]
MDGHSSDHSPSGSLLPGESWLQCWENEINSISGLNLQGSSTELGELNSLVEDKEIAAKAVAFVVNSTRKGIVPLCADVANLLRTKRSLEKKVFKLKKENDVLRSTASLSVRTSHSTSPTPASLSSEKGSFTEHSFQLQERCRPCSRCSQSSSTISHSPQFHEKNNRQRLTSLQNSPASLQETLDSQARRHSSPKFRRSRSCNRTQGGITTKALVHHPGKEATTPKQTDGLDSKPSAKEERKNSLPEIVSEPSADIKKISPAVNNIEPSKDICTSTPGTLVTSKPLTTPDTLKSSDPVTTPVSVMTSDPVVTPDSVSRPEPPDMKSLPKNPSDHDLEDQFTETLRINSKLVDDLGAAHKEIANLRCRLRELEMKQLTSDCTGEFYIENECDSSGLRFLEDRMSWVNNNNSHNSKKSKHCSLPKFGVKKVQPISPLFCEPLHGCKCAACEEAFGSDDEITQNLAEGFPENHRKFSVSHRLQVQMNDHVVAKGDRTGFIRYLGHLDGIGHPNMLFVGLELDSPGGQHDGCIGGKRYFYCKKNHGVFVPLQEILCKVSKKISRKVSMFDGSDTNSKRTKSNPDFPKCDDTDRDNIFS